MRTHDKTHPIDHLLNSIERLRSSGYGALVYAPPTNQDPLIGARLIVRIIDTPAGPQFALHELDAYGRTGSGLYGNADDITLSAVQRIERYNKQFERVFGKENTRSTNMRWHLLGYEQLPPHLLMAAA